MSVEIDWSVNTLDWLNQFAERLQWARAEYAKAKSAHDVRMDHAWSQPSWRMGMVYGPHPNDEEKIYRLQARRRYLALEMRRCREARLYVLHVGGAVMLWGTA